MTTNTSTDRNVDKIEFKLIDAKTANEPWSEDFEKSVSVIEIYINGKEIVSVLKEIEQPYCDEEGNPQLAGDYGHNTPEELYKDLSDAVTEDTYSNKCGAYLLCCRGCGFSGCWSVEISVRQTDEYVYWENFRQNHRENWQYNLLYKFDRTEYDKAMEQLKSFINASSTDSFDLLTAY